MKYLNDNSNFALGRTMTTKLDRPGKLRHTSIAVLLCGMTIFPGLMQGQSGKLSKDLQHISASGNVDVIVQYRTMPTDAHYARVSNRGGALRQDLRTLKAGAFKVSVKSLPDLANDPDVSFISPDRPVAASSNYSNPDFYEDAVLAQAAWTQYDGSGIGVAIIDSGIASRSQRGGGFFSYGLSNGSDFGNRVVYNQSFVQGEKWIFSDPYGHGTHVAGILAGNGANSTGFGFTKTFVGMAGNANLINLRVLDENGSGTDSQVIAAIQTAIQLKDVFNIRILNLSLGRGVFENYTQDPLCQAVEAAWKAGIVVVVAAGNDGRNDSAGTEGYGTINAPGNDPYVITVGAMKPMGTPTRTDDLIASYSSKGPTLFDHIVKPDLVAPGNRIISVLSSQNAPLYSSANALEDDYYFAFGGERPSRLYYLLNGTSMATPVVSGAAALVLQQNPNMTPDQVKARLMKTAYKNFPRYSTATDPTTGISYTSQYDIFTVGAGYLDVQNAIQTTELAPATLGSAMSPQAEQDSAGGLYMGNNPSAVWGNSVLWGTSDVWGSQVLWGTTISSESVLWGTSYIQDQSVLWGSSSTTASSVLWGSASPEAVSIQILGEQ